MSFLFLHAQTINHHSTTNGATFKDVIFCPVKALHHFFKKWSHEGLRNPIPPPPPNPATTSSEKILNFSLSFAQGKKLPESFSFCFLVQTEATGV